MNISIIGSGAVATHLSVALYKAGHKIGSVFSRNITNATALAEKVKAKPTDNIADITESDIIIIAVSDDSIESVVKQLPNTNAIVVHTSGSVSLDVFNGRIKNYGSFYPLQTFSKEKQVDFLKIPIFIEASDNEIALQLMELGKSISSNVNVIDSKKRAELHLAAVFACNFTNHLYSIADSILKGIDLDISVLKPLIKESVNKLDTLSPLQAQTGPAARSDHKIIDKHLDLLSNDKELQQIYQIFTKRIISSCKLLDESCKLPKSNN